jgi:hypothetical protein
MLRLTIALPLLLLAADVSSQVYRWVDPDGQTHYSDHPTIGSDRVTLDGAAPSGATNSESPPSSSAPLLGPYTSFEVLSPEANQTLRLESPSVPVSLLLDPPLMDGHRLELLVDGVPVKVEEPLGTQLSLNGLSWGTHVTQARVLDSAGIVAQSAPVSFHLRKPLPPGVIP